MSTPQEKQPNSAQDAKGHDISIVINGRSHPVNKQEMTFAEIVALSGQPTGSDVTHTVTFRRGQGNKPEGSLVDGENVKLKDGMIFNVTATTKS